MPITCDCNMNCDEELSIIYKGTTPTFIFNVCLNTDDLDLANTHIMFVSGSGNVDKSGNDILVDEKTLSCSLTSSETLRFTGTNCYVQILATMKNGQKPASTIMQIPISSTLKGGGGW